MYPWAGPIVEVKKQTPEGAPQQFCLYINKRKISSLLTAVTLSLGTLTHMPLHKIDKLFALLKGAKYFMEHDL